MTQFVVCYTTRDSVHANLHAYVRNADEDGLRAFNHGIEIVRQFIKGNEERIIQRAPEDGERVMFEVWLDIAEFRNNKGGAYGACDFRQIQPCPQCVAEAGHDIYRQIKRVLARARKEAEKNG